MNHIDGFNILTKKTNILKTLREFYERDLKHVEGDIMEDPAITNQTCFNLNNLLNKTRYDTKTNDNPTFKSNRHDGRLTRDNSLG